jgi:hypothetical protein
MASKKASVTDALLAPVGRKQLAQGVSPGIISRYISSAGGAADHFVRSAICRPYGAHIGIAVVPALTRWANLCHASGARQEPAAQGGRYKTTLG